MKFYLNGREVEVRIDSNRDGSRFIAEAYFVDSDEALTDSELDQLQDAYEDSEALNGMWG